MIIPNEIVLHEKKFELFISSIAIQNRIAALAQVINEDYRAKNPVFIGVLKGCFLFYADLVRKFDGQCEAEFVKLSSYVGTQSSGAIEDAFGMPLNLTNRHVILVEDIVETGLTLQYLVEKLNQLSPASVSVCSLLYKPLAIKSELAGLNYLGFEIANDFVVGYGLDYQGFGRNLTAIYKAI